MEDYIVQKKRNSMLNLQFPLQINNICIWPYFFKKKNNISYPCPDINGLGVGDRRQLGVDARRLRGHGEQRGDAERDAGRDGVLVEPERDPRDDDEHAARHVDGDQVVGELALEDQLHLQAAVLSCEKQEQNILTNCTLTLCFKLAHTFQLTSFYFRLPKYSLIMHTFKLNQLSAVNFVLHTL